MAHTGSTPGKARELGLKTNIIGVGARVGVACMKLILRVAIAGFFLVLCLFACGGKYMLVFYSLIKNKNLKKDFGSTYETSSGPIDSESSSSHPAH